MKRRGFLGALGAAIAGATLDPERALWVPGRKMISVPNPRRVSTHSIHEMYLAGADSKYRGFAFWMEHFTIRIAA